MADLAQKHGFLKDFDVAAAAYLRGFKGSAEPLPQGKVSTMIHSYHSVSQSDASFPSSPLMQIFRSRSAGNTALHLIAFGPSSNECMA